MPVTDLGDTDGWTAEPVDHDPFASVPDSDTTRNALPGRGLGGVFSDPSAQITAFHHDPYIAAAKPLVGQAPMLGKGYPADFTTLYNQFAAAYAQHPEEVANERARGGGPWTSRMDQLDNLKGTMDWTRKEAPHLRRLPLGAQDYIASQPDYEEWEQRIPLDPRDPAGHTFGHYYGEPMWEQEGVPEHPHVWDLHRLFGNQIWGGYLGGEPFEAEGGDANPFGRRGGWGLRSGGRIAMADGGALEPVDYDPFGESPAADRTVHDTDIWRAKGWPEPRSPMHERLAALMRPGFQDGGDLPEGVVDPSIAAHGGYGTPMTSADILAGRAGPVQEARPYQDPTFGGAVGTAFEHGAERLGAPMSVVRKAGEIGQTAAGFTGLDMPYHVQQAALAAKHGDYGYAAGEALGAIPVIPGAAGVRWTEAGKLIRDAQTAGKESRAAAVSTIRDAQQTQLNCDIDQLPQYTPVPQAPRKSPVGSQNVNAAIRDLPIDQQLAKAETDPHLIRDTDPKASSLYVGGPTEVKKPADLTALRNRNYGYLASMPNGWDWYDRYRSILGQLHGDTPAPGNAIPAGTWSSSMEGQWSAQRPPQTEFGMAQKERSGAIAGIPQRANTQVQQEAFYRALETGDPSAMQLGSKTGQYARLIEPSRGLLPPQATGVNDFRYATQWGYREPDGTPWDRALTDAQHRFIDNETARLVKWANDNRISGKTDWTGEQIQAAIWVRQKAEQALRDSPGQVEQHLGKMSPEEAYQKAFAEHAWPMGNATIEEHLPKYTTYTTHEAQPGLAPGGTGHLPLAAQMTDEQRQAFKDNPLSSWLSPEGHDRLYSGLGVAGTPQVSMMTLPASPSLGKFESAAGVEYNPATVGRVVTGLGAKESEEEGAKTLQDFNPADKAILQAGETLRAAVDAQNASAAHRIFKGGSPKEMNALDIPLKGATREQLNTLERIGAPYGLDEAIDRGQFGVTLTGFKQQPNLAGKNYNTLLADLQKGGFGGDIERGKIASIYANLEGQWKAGPGSGQVTQTVLDAISRTPQLREAFAQNPHLAEIARNRILRDNQAAQQWGGIRRDRQNLLGLIAMGRGWPDRLEQARKYGLKALVPAAASAGFVLYPEAGLPAEIDRTSRTKASSTPQGTPAAVGRASLSQRQ